MRKMLAVIALIGLQSGLASCNGPGRPFAAYPIEVEYWISTSADGHIEAEVYNPWETHAARVPEYNWPGRGLQGDVLTVVGMDGVKWKYKGFAGSSFRPEIVRIEPKGRLQFRLNIHDFYEPATGETRIHRIYYGALFIVC